MPHPTSEDIEQVFREQYGRAVATLIRTTGDIDLAEEAVQEAFAAAIARWPSTGIPPSPAGWLITTARHRAVDRLRREATRHTREKAALDLLDQSPEDGQVGVEEGPVRDDRLRLLFTCCHPA